MYCDPVQTNTTKNESKMYRMKENPLKIYIKRFYKNFDLDIFVMILRKK